MVQTTAGSGVTAPFALNYSFKDLLAAAGIRVHSIQSHGEAGILVRISNLHRVGSIVVTQSDWDGVEWLHASIAYSTTPTYDDLALLHRAVFGRKRYAYQVFAPESDHIDIHENALHLWGRADGAIITPDFGMWGMI